MTRPSFLTEQRLRTLESRTGRLEENHEALDTTVYTLHRRVTKVELIVTAIATHLGLPLPTDADIDAALDGQ